ncbi:MAG: hypothetical protein ACE5K4_10855 [Candidatus Hydrothermarchaeota archaeon]
MEDRLLKFKMDKLENLLKQMDKRLNNIEVKINEMERKNSKKWETRFLFFVLISIMLVWSWLLLSYVVPIRI